MPPWSPTGATPAARTPPERGDDGTGSVRDLPSVFPAPAAADDPPRPCRSRPCPAPRSPALVRCLSIAVLAALLLGAGVLALPVAAASRAKVVVVVGPVGSHNAHYKS